MEMVRSLEGGHPGFLAFQNPGELSSAFDAQLRVGAREVAFDGLERHVQLVGDLAIRPTAAGEPYDAQLARRQRLDAGAPRTSRPGPGCLELFARASREWTGTTAGREVERFDKRLACGRTLAVPAQRRSQLRQGVPPLEHSWRAPENSHGLRKELERGAAPLGKSCGAQGDSKRSRRAERSDV